MSARTKIAKSLQVGAYAPQVFTPSPTGENLKRAVGELHLTGITICGETVNADASKSRTQPPLRDIRLSFDHFILNNTKGSAIEDDQVENVAAALNDQLARDDPKRYSQSQVKRALWKFLERQIDELLEDLEDRFMRLDSYKQDRLLGDPEIDVKVEARREAGDRECDERRGT